MIKEKPKPRKITSIEFKKDNERFKVTPIINKKIRGNPYIITNKLDEAVNLYLDKCKKYNIKPDIKLIYSYNSSKK